MPNDLPRELLINGPVGHIDCLLLHGEQDEMAPLANLLDWARPDQRPLTLFTGANHFFNGCLNVAAGQVARHLNAALFPHGQ